MIVFVVLLWVVFSLVALYFLVKYRVRVEIHLDSSSPTRTRLPVRPSAKPEGSQGTGQQQPSLGRAQVLVHFDLIVSALRNLKVKERRAQDIAATVCARNPGAEFDILLREALREAA